MTDTPFIELAGATRTSHLENGDITSLDHISLDAGKNKFIALMGWSGSGKSTMMNRPGILVTHDPEIAEHACRTLRLVDGRIADS